MVKQGAIEFVHIDKYYGSNHVLNDFSFQINAGEFLSLLGPSGCGKTTILRLAAGLERLNGGEIRMDGTRIDTLEPHKRRLNTVFQSYALFPNMNVYDNIAYGLRAYHRSGREVKEKVEKILETVKLTELAERQPSQLSGGQRQRVAIARAVVNEPPVLLLDEPLSALDLKLRKEMRFELRSLQKQLGITFVYVTHDQEEALVMSDRIAVMSKGKIEQVGRPQEIYKNPTSQFVAEFIGESNTFESVVTRTGNDGTLQFSGEVGSALARGNGFRVGELVNVSVRPDMIQWSSAAENGFDLQGTVCEHVFTGPFHKAIVNLSNGDEVKITRLSTEVLPDIGQKVNLFWDLGDAVVMHNYSDQVFTFIGQNTFAQAE